MKYVDTVKYLGVHITRDLRSYKRKEFRIRMVLTSYDVPTFLCTYILIIVLYIFSNVNLVQVSNLSSLNRMNEALTTVLTRRLYKHCLYSPTYISAVNTNWKVTPKNVQDIC